jgi:hypothetical protein
MTVEEPRCKEEVLSPLQAARVHEAAAAVGGGTAAVCMHTTSRQLPAPCESIVLDCSV